MNTWELLQYNLPDLMVKTNSNIPQSSFYRETFQAKVKEQLTGALFSIQKGNTVMKAVIAGQVEVGEEYVFQTRLKQSGQILIIETKVESHNNQPASIPSKLVIKESGGQLSISERVHTIMLREGLQLPRAEMQRLIKLIEGFSGIQKEVAMELTSFLIAKNSPITIREGLQMLALTFLSNENTLSSLQKVHQIVQTSPLPEADKGKMNILLENMLQESPVKSKQEAFHYIKNIIPLLGLNYEQELVHNLQRSQSLALMKWEQLKPLLMELSHWVNGEEKAVVSQLVSKVTGFQLLTREEGVWQHLFLPIPVLLGKKANDWYVHISSKKQNGEKLDPNYCRIVLLLNLPLYSELIVEIFIQQRVVSITIQHSFDPIEELIEKGLPTLKENISRKGYTLSAIKTTKEKDFDDEAAVLHYLKSILSPVEKGVDVKV